MKINKKLLSIFMGIGTFGITLFFTVFGIEICKIVYNHWIFYLCFILADIYLWSDYIFTIFFWNDLE